MMSVLLVLRFSCSDLCWKLVCHVEQKFGKRDKVFNLLLSGRLFAFMKKSIRIFAETMSSIGQSLGDHSRLSKVLNLLLEITLRSTEFANDDDSKNGPTLRRDKGWPRVLTKQFSRLVEVVANGIRPCSMRDQRLYARRGEHNSEVGGKNPVRHPSETLGASFRICSSSERTTNMIGFVQFGHRDIATPSEPRVIFSLCVPLPCLPPRTVLQRGGIAVETSTGIASTS